ncbi:putative Myb-like transcription factor [Eremomyces bilateralis CBS 781.70]|uniref:Transcriptional adapter 2 n=1 Tax=Eremomyces bilateralis CBS 781.70 TaxID=1392243 RepID=A0A6G1G686_9PEZI|nr:putative Myb-like transcription factor [Eremomyces bilateralis CBS 781.70]KAF1813548.1 putative Myb-like transcription factor [Eremomyces bilateralis CBS 781.70]
MGVIKKKTAVRGTEGGVKYVCDVCSSDITSTVRIQCAVCHDYDLCVPCFSQGKSTRDHDPSTHSYRVIEQHSIPIFTDDWGADEEMLLLEGAETYGLGSWADIADHIGGYRFKDEVRDHYISTYIDSPNFPLPLHASPEDNELTNGIPREEFQARKKRRIEERKEAAKNAPPATPKQKPTASVPACHEVQGYMPGRLEFETEYFNEAEEAVQHMQFDPGDGINPRTGELEPEMELKMTIMDIYNSRLTARIERKKIIFEHRLLEYRKNAALDKKRTKEEKDLLAKAKPFARIMTHDDFDEFSKGLEYEHNLRIAIQQLQEWRRMQIATLKSGEKYELEKQHRASRGPAPSAFDRMGVSRIKSAVPPETASGAVALIAPELPIRLQKNLASTTDASAPKPVNGTHALPNGTTPPFPPPAFKRDKFSVPPLPNQSPLRFNNEAVPDLHLLTPEEREVCSVLRIQPKPYVVIKESAMRESAKSGGGLKRKALRDICRLDVNKSNRLFDFFVHSGWVAKG